VLSVDEVKVFKPDPRVYGAPEDRLGVPPAGVLKSISDLPEILLGAK